MGIRTKKVIRMAAIDMTGQWMLPDLFPTFMSGTKFSTNPTEQYTMSETLNLATEYFYVESTPWHTANKKYGISLSNVKKVFQHFINTHFSM